MATYSIPNKPTNISLNEFMSISGKYGSFAKNARYIVQIHPVGSLVQNTTAMANELKYLCDSASFPARGFNALPYTYYGPTWKTPIQTVYDQLQLSFLCRSESYERQFFDDWMEKINPTSTFDFAFQDEYACQIRIFQLAEYAGKKGDDPVTTYSWTVHDAWPILVNAQPVSWAENSVQKLSVSFSFKYWTRDNRDKKPFSHDILQNGVVQRNNGRTII